MSRSASPAEPFDPWSSFSATRTSKRLIPHHARDDRDPGSRPPGRRRPLLELRRHGPLALDAGAHAVVPPSAERGRTRPVRYRPSGLCRTDGVPSKSRRSRCPCPPAPRPPAGPRRRERGPPRRRERRPVRDGVRRPAPTLPPRGRRPPGEPARSGQRFRLRERGLPSPANARRGDPIVEVIIPPPRARRACQRSSCGSSPQQHRRRPRRAVATARHRQKAGRHARQGDRRRAPTRSARSPGGTTSIPGGRASAKPAPAEAIPGRRQHPSATATPTSSTPTRF